MLGGFPFGYGNWGGAFAFEDDGGGMPIGVEMISSRLSWFSTLSTCKIIMMLQFLQPYMV